MAVTEAFGRFPLEHGGSFAADSAVVEFGAQGVDLAGLLAQQLSWNYNQPISRIYELGSNLAFYIAGRPQGMAQLARVLGPAPITTAFYRTYGNVCRAGENLITFAAVTGCHDAEGPVSESSFLEIGMTGVTLNSIAGSIRAEDMLLNEQLSMMFLAMFIADATDVEEDEVDGGGGPF